MITSDKINKYLSEKFALIFKHDRREITDEAYVKKFNELEKNIQTEQERLINDYQSHEAERFSDLKKKQDDLRDQNLMIIKKEAKQIINKEENNMADEKKVDTPKAEKVKKVVNKRADSIAATILDVLSQKGTKNVDNAVKRVMEKKPDAVAKNIKGQIGSIIKLVKAGNKRFCTYTWDEAAYLMTKKQ
jgi:hypothetical protein